MRAGRAISSATRRRGLSESVGFWKTIWIRRRASRERASRAAASGSPSRRIRPAAGCVQAGDAARDRRLARARLPDEREALARGDARTNVLGRDDRLVTARRARRARPSTRRSGASPAPRSGAPSGRLELERAASAPLEAAHGVARRRPPPAAAASRVAALDPLRAARRERAPGGPLADADRDARDAAEPTRRDVIRDRRDEPARVRVPRPREQLRRPAPPRRCARRT